MPIPRNPDTEMAITIAAAVGAAGIAGLARLCADLVGTGIVSHDLATNVQQAILADLRQAHLPMAVAPIVEGAIQRAFR